MTWTLAIDYGTSFTAAAMLTEGGEIELLEIDDARRFPSCAVLDSDGELVVGRRAVHLAQRRPEHFERAPKRTVGAPGHLLGGRVVEAEAMVAAVLAAVFGAALTRQGNSRPQAVRLTHPASWGADRLAVLRRAAESAGIGAVELLSEPEAAAWFFVADRRGEEPKPRVGESVAVYDLGGGTFDTAVLQRERAGFALAGHGGNEVIGGEAFDQRLLDYVLTEIARRYPAVSARLETPADHRARRDRLQLEEDVRQLKEHLSDASCEVIAIATEEDPVDLEITKAEFERLIRADLEESVTILEKTITDAGLRPENIAVVYLTGGSSRIPLAYELVRAAFPNTFTRSDPKTLVAQGALAERKPAPPPADRQVASGGDDEATDESEASTPGALLEQRGDLAGAEAAYRRGDKRGGAPAANNLGTLLEERGDLAGAEAAYRRGDKRGDDNAANNLGILLEERGDLAGAEAAYRRGDERGDHNAALNLGLLLEERGDLAGAEAAYRRGDKRGDDNAANNLGILLEERGDLAGAEAAYRRGDKRGDDNAANNLGILLEERGDLAGAEAAYRRGDERGDQNATLNLGRLLEDRGDLAGAEAAYRRADGRGDGMAAYHLGLLLHDRGDLTGAQAAYDRAASNDPEVRDLARDALRRVLRPTRSRLKWHR